MKLNQCSEKLKILSVPERLQILKLLSIQSLNVSELKERVEIAQNLLSYHLKILEENGWIASEREGKFVYYSGTDLLSDNCDKLDINLGCCHIEF